ncbi:MAG: spore photoproduct lyase [Bacillota bacterium]
MFIPKRVYFEPEALDYPLGQELKQRFSGMGIPIRLTGSHNRVTGIPGKTVAEGYREAKSTLVVGVRRGKDFQSCKPSAHFQLPLATSCPGMCEYCYLATTLGKKPYLRIYVNIDEILARAAEYISQHMPDITVFEGGATSDPVPVEPLTGSLRKAVEFFSSQPNGRFRFATKFTDIGGLCKAEHNNHTRVRFSINTEEIIRRYEHRTPSLKERIKAAQKLWECGYPIGFLVAPIFLEGEWRQEYGQLFAQLRQEFSQLPKDLTFELITHRFTARAKNNLLALFPNTSLPLNEKERQFKFGQFGYGKYVYEKNAMDELRRDMTGLVHQYFPEGKIDYLV